MVKCLTFMFTGICKHWVDLNAKRPDSLTPVSLLDL
jgi:hypothetical protein